MSDHIPSVSKFCFLSIRDLRRTRNTLDFSSARTIATSLIHSKRNYCNSLFLNLPQSQLGRPQLILNSSARAVSKTCTEILFQTTAATFGASIGTATDSTLLLALSSHQFHSQLKTILYLNNPFLLSLVCINSCRFSGSLS